MAISSIVNRGMVNEGIADATALATARTVGVVESAMTLNVGSGQDFTTLQEAMDWIEARILLAPVTIQIADGTYNMASGVGFSFRHPNYQLVSIFGNQGTPSNVTFNFSGSVSNFHIRNCRLRQLQGIKIYGGTHSIRVEYGGVIEDLAYIEASYSSSIGIFCEHNATICGNYINSHHHTSHGWFAGGQAYIFSYNASSTNNAYGFIAATGATIRIPSTGTVNNNSAANYAPALESENTLGALITVT